MSGKHVAVLMGGLSSERPVSLSSGNACAAALEGEGFKVKRIQVRPGKRLSYQRHQFRNEHWTVVRGSGVITLEGRDRIVRAGDAIDIPIRAAHRVANSGDEPLVFIEVQRGSYLGEDDIVRLQDDFGRVPQETVRA